MSNPIKRQYLSPNCTLFVDGFSDDSSDQISPVMSILTQVQFQIIGVPQILSGGLSFVENLMKAISSYTQSLLSGLPHPSAKIDSNSDLIEFQKHDDQNRHLLIIWDGDKSSNEKKIEIELTTIQLFDLQDTIDQLAQDNATLPQITNTLEPLSRRYRQSDVSIVEQSTPAVLGFVSLSIAAAIMFMIPHPTTIEDPNLATPAIESQTEEVIPSEDESESESNPITGE